MNSNIGQCPICRIQIDAYEPHDIDNGHDFHPHCWIKHITMKISRLDSKLNKKTITLEEAEELQESKTMLMRSLDEMNHKIIPKKIIEKNLNLITRPELREEYLHSNLEKKMDKQKLLREIRWNAEALSGSQQKQIL